MPRPPDQHPIQPGDPNQPNHPNQPDNPPTPLTRERITQVMGVWREAARRVETELGPEWHTAYNRQAAAGESSLSPYTTMPDLVRHYLDTTQVHRDPDHADQEADQHFAQVMDQLQRAAGEHLHIVDYRLIDTATYFWRAQQLIAEQTAQSAQPAAPTSADPTRRETRVETQTKPAGPVELDPEELLELERSPLSPAARDELRRRMVAGEEVYPYQSGGPAGRWVVWLTDNPGRVHVDVWEAIVSYWQTRAAVRREGTNEELTRRYGLQGPAAQRAAAARLGALAMLRADHPDHARQIVLYAYHEADSYLQAHSPEEGDAEES